MALYLNIVWLLSRNLQYQFTPQVSKLSGLVGQRPDKCCEASPVGGLVPWTNPCLPCMPDPVTSVLAPASPGVHHICPSSPTHYRPDPATALPQTYAAYSTHHSLARLAASCGLSLVLLSVSTISGSPPSIGSCGSAGQIWPLVCTIAHQNA